MNQIWCITWKDPVSYRLYDMKAQLSNEFKTLKSKSNYQWNWKLPASPMHFWYLKWLPIESNMMHDMKRSHMRWKHNCPTDTSMIWKFPNELKSLKSKWNFRWKWKFHKTKKQVSRWKWKFPNESESFTLKVIVPQWKQFVLFKVKALE